jgi:hypothetical protein
MNQDKDLKGMRFGKLIVIDLLNKVKRGSSWKTKCDCGNEKNVIGSNLLKGITKSCGCLIHTERKLDLVGMYFGELKVIKFLGVDKGNYMWQCICSCGNVIRTSSGSLRNKKIQTCHKCTNKKHGHSVLGRKTPEYTAWCNMLARCRNEDHKQYHAYGGRGIKVCDRWLSFENFFVDMGMRTSNKHSIDRINNDGNYEPSNCRWATRKEQANNTRRNRFLTYGSTTMTLTEWGSFLDMKEDALWTKLTKRTLEQIVESYMFQIPLKYYAWQSQTH